MSKTYRPWNAEQQWLLPPSPREWLPENDLVYFVLDVAGQLDLATSGQTGNTDKRAISLGGRLQWHKGARTDFVVLNYDYGKSAGVKDTDKTYIHARHIQQFRPARAWEAFGQLQQDEFTRLSHRGLAGGGIRFTLVPPGAGKVAYVGVGAFYEREKLEEQAGATDAGTQTLSRASTYLTFKYNLNEQVGVVTTTYYQPAFEDGHDFRLLEQAGIRVKLSRVLDLKLSLDIIHDSRPPQFIEKTDVMYSTGIEYRFR